MVPKVLSLLWHSRAKALLDTSSFGSFFFLLPPSEDTTLPSTIRTSATVLAGLPDVIAEKTREEGDESLANGINQQPHGTIGFPSLTPLTLLITPLPSSSGLAEEPGVSRASVPMALKCWTLPYTCFPVSASSIPYSLKLFLLKSFSACSQRGNRVKFSLSTEGSQSTFSASPVSPQPTLLGWSKLWAVPLTHALFFPASCFSSSFVPIKATLRPASYLWPSFWPPPIAEW